MKTELLELLRCPMTRQQLVLGVDEESLQEIESGWLVSEDGQHRYPVRNGIPRFVPESNYADNFGMQWNHFSRTQLDSYSASDYRGLFLESHRLAYDSPQTAATARAWMERAGMLDVEVLHAGHLVARGFKPA